MAGSAERKKQNQRQAKAKQKPKASRPVSVRFVLQEQDSIPTVNRPGAYGKPKEPRNAAQKTGRGFFLADLAAVFQPPTVSPAQPAASAPPGLGREAN
jgi:hypothetical protein